MSDNLLDSRGSRPDDELPSDLRRYFVGYQRATAECDTSGVRARLREDGFFEPAARPGQRWRALLYACALLFALTLALLAVRGVFGKGEPLYAEVVHVSGPLTLDRDGQHSRMSKRFRLFAGDTLRCGADSCRIKTAEGWALAMGPGSVVRCVVPRHGQKPVLEFAHGRTRLETGKDKVVFQAAGELFSCCGTACTIERCCERNEQCAFRIRAEGSGLARKMANSPRFSSCTAGNEYDAGSCRACGINSPRDKK